MKMFEKSLRICVTKYAKKTKVVSDILDYIIQTVYHNMKYFKQFFKNIPYMLKFEKEIETFCIYIAVKVFSKKRCQGYAINKLKQIFNITLPLLENFCFRMKQKLTSYFLIN